MPLIKASDIADSRDVERAPLCPPNAAPAEEDCQDWGPDPGAERYSDGVQDNENDWEQGDVKPLTCCQQLKLFGILVAAAPAIVGSWCWPSLVGLIAGVASSSSYQNKTAHVTEFFHGFQVALMGIIMTNMTQWIFAKCKAKRSSLPSTTWSEHFVKWRPVYLMCISTVMVMFQPISILVIGSWQIGDPYNFYWTDDTKQTAFPNKAKGWVIQVLMTYGGFIVMFFGMNEALGLIAKFKKRWRATKAGMQASNAV